MENESPPFNDILLYTTADGVVRVDVLYEEESFWLSQKKMAELFGVDVRTINEHLQNIYKSGELVAEGTIRNFRIVQTEGQREVAREIDFYNLDAIIAVGYRVNSHRATQFRIWATQTLKEFILKGFVLDEERLKQGKRLARTILTNCSNASAKFGQVSAGFIKKSRTSMLPVVLITTLNHH